jgi:acetyl-CoA carboxylase, biotin carboxylase subunit
MSLFDEVLIANRGIIATRAIKTLKKLGIKSAAVYTPEDSLSLHVKEADRSFCIRDYREAAELVSVADYLKKGKLSIGIHPGYGFLSEDSDFAQICDEHFVFIGPSFEVIERMGSKMNSKKEAKIAGVPVIPSFDESIKNENDAVKIAEKLGFPDYPIMIKSDGGGGGMGIGEARGKALEDIIEPYKKIKNYAKINFKHNFDVFFERLIENPKHIEIQIIGDKYGNVVSLGERDCSIQRRHQKIIEFSPASIDPDLRNEMEKSAIKLAKQIGYSNAGTFEFLVDKNGQFYFMEINTRLQVEHRVTEARCNVDLVELQVKVAAGEKLPFSQKEINPKGFSIEARIYAEDPYDNFKPCLGKVSEFVKPKGENIIADSHLSKGYTIPIKYDSHLLNLIAYGDDVKTTKEKMISALNDFVIKGDGINTNINYIKELLDEKF